jgi:hypothetical protein
MVKIDLANATNALYVTLREKSVGANPSYKLELLNFYTSETFLWSSLTPISDDRIDVITLVTSTEFLGRTPQVGQYKYSFFEYLGLTSGSTYSLVEIGMAKVLDTGDTDPYVYIQPTETDDDYIVL